MTEGFGEFAERLKKLGLFSFERRGKDVSH